MKLSSERLGSFFTFYILLDISITCVFAVTAIFTGSLILMAEALRGVLLVILCFFNLLIMHLSDDRKPNRFDYGFHQLQHLIWVGIGLSLVAVSVWIGHSSINGSLIERSWINPKMMTIAAVANACCVYVNYCIWHSLKTGALGHQSAFARRQICMRRNIFWTSIATQSFFTFAVIFHDPKIAFFCDLLGFALLGVVSLAQGTNMIKRGLPVVLNTRLDQRTREVVHTAVHQKLPPGMVSSIMTRGGEDWIDARVVCNSSSPGSSGLCAELVEAVQAELRGQGLNVSLRTWVCRRGSSN